MVEILPFPSSSPVMRAQNRSPFLALLLVIPVSVCICGDQSRAADKRAPAPRFEKADTEGIFFDSAKTAIRGERPPLAKLRSSKAKGAAPSGAKKAGEVDAAQGGEWDAILSSTSIEDEIKRVKLHYDSTVTQPGPFKSGGYEEARLDLMVMSSLFAIITEYAGDVRWKKDAPAARDLMARTAFNCNAGTTQVFNEARARKDDLVDLMSGSGLRSGKAAEGNDWTIIADRSPMMEYAESLSEQLRQATNDEATVKSEPEDVRRPAELLAMIGKILAKEGMDESDDEDYVQFCQQMTKAASDVTRGLEVEDYKAIREAVGALTQSCDACHESYR